MMIPKELGFSQCHAGDLGTARMEIYPVKRFHTVQTTFQTTFRTHRGRDKDGLVMHDLCPLFKPNSYVRTPSIDLGSLGFFIYFLCQYDHSDYINFFLCFSSPAQPGGDIGDQITFKVLMQRRFLPRATFPSGTHCYVSYIVPMSLSSLGFFLSIKVLIVLGHRVSGKILLVYIRKCLAQNSKHIKDLAISFYEYERLWAVMGLPNLIRC